MNKNINMYAVLVTYNRLEKLKNTLLCYEKQTRLPDKVIIVNNASTDGTKEYLEKWTLESHAFSHIIINMEKNLGGSGGFYTGIERALKENADWIWVSDDDAYPEELCFEKIEKAINKHHDKNLGAVCGTVVEGDKIAYLHRRNYKFDFGIKYNQVAIPHNDYETKECIEINEFSYVGTCINAESIKSCGLPNKDFFIWYDDTEHSVRIAKKYNILLIPDIKIIHDCDAENNSIGVNWKNYYGQRNFLYMLINDFGKIKAIFAKIFYKLTNVKMNIKKVVKKDENVNKLLQIRKDAYKDAINRNLGINEKYRPGTKV